jgi:hypothetical protein
MHRLLLDAKSGQIRDHIDRNKLNNHRSNLRFVTARQSILNRVMGNSTGYIGVKPSPRKYGKWWIAVASNKYIGCYSTPEEAARARDKAMLASFGPEHIVLNFPMESEVSNVTT